MLKTHVVAVSDEVVPLVHVNARSFIGNNLLIACMRKKTHYRHMQTNNWLQDIEHEVAEGGEMMKERKKGKERKQ